MRDADIRPLLVRAVRARYPDARVMDELGLMYGHVRVDVAALSPNCLHGYEIKGDADDLRRLPEQVRLYSEALDRCTLAVGERHLHKAAPLLPPWWGIVRARQVDGALVLEPEREDQENPEPTAHATLHLLWRPELLALLDAAREAKGIRSASKGRLFRRALERIPADELRAHVRRVLVTREGWR
ncbi:MULTISPECIES: sce7726 family protein [Myxococcus]|uniref:sce7726 family protein n=1 Tax=Myxococcus TaxID=32 RepID=UPI001141D0E1|nr:MULTISPECIES: sce7726 family protein [Myxococcus]NOK05813.1 sce7726 family protein [Myxococcus xanthus]